MRIAIGCIPLLFLFLALGCSERAQWGDNKDRDWCEKVDTGQVVLREYCHGDPPMPEFHWVHTKAR